MSSFGFPASRVRRSYYQPRTPWHRGRCPVNRVTWSLLQSCPPASSPSMSFRLLPLPGAALPSTSLSTRFPLPQISSSRVSTETQPSPFKDFLKHTHLPPAPHKLTRKLFILNLADMGPRRSAVGSLHPPGLFGSLMSRCALQTDTSLYMGDLMGKTMPFTSLA